MREPLPIPILCSLVSSDLSSGCYEHACTDAGGVIGIAKHVKAFEVADESARNGGKG